MGATSIETYNIEQDWLLIQFKGGAQTAVNLRQIAAVSFERRKRTGLFVLGIFTVMFLIGILFIILAYKLGYVVLTIETSGGRIFELPFIRTPDAYHAVLKEISAKTQN